MKYLCLAYGGEKAWNELAESDQDRLLALDDVLRKRGDLVAAVGLQITTVRAWDGTPVVTEGALADLKLPLAGFSIIEASDLNPFNSLLIRRAREQRERLRSGQSRSSIFESREVRRSTATEPE
jgi:hypothetical protein